MTARVLETVPNLSEGRDPGFVAAVVQAMREAGADVLDSTADSDHNRCVVTAIGAPTAVEDAAVAAAHLALERIDLRRHRGVHPRIGALDVVPFVPLVGLTMADACDSARRVAGRIAREVGLPVFLYGHASDPPGRRLSDLRRGGFEAMAGRWPADRQPDMLPPDWALPGTHPSAGAVCVGARAVLLAWNVYVSGVPLEALRRIAAAVRETGGGHAGVRALALYLEGRDQYQISMNLEDAETVSAIAVFTDIEMRVGHEGGRIDRTEVIGLAPDRLLFDAAADRLALDPQTADRVLSRRLARHLAG
jgi:glutamate formiminotransferase